VESAKRSEGAFLNEPIDVSDLPPLPTERFEPIDPRLLRIRLAADAIVAAVVVVGAVALAAALPADSAMPRWVPLVVAAVVVVLVGLVAWLQWLEISHLGYLVRDKDFSFRRGVVGRSVTTVPYARVQYVSIDRGPLARAFGLATLQMRTAGSAGLTVPGMTNETAERLKAMVVDRAGALADDEYAEVR
jgi:membrane protein YdbS with pleckstrin-like domain